ncbi:DUF5979 domain-containing protein [Actinomyces slackii]|uniref:Uncharacterized protein n=2 Tax=Actinomyces slackii TaxID=52774 RepID=A0A448KFU1_9ACTO|nr:DUF5979 domain-containing protein [Actinomyces slackii]VEG75748.1 Uncharacterised protein [Actinomyces slackii]
MNTVSTGTASRPPLVRGAGAGIAAILTLMLAAIAPLVTAPAQADENQGITVTNMTLTRVDGNNVDREGALTYYDHARLNFDWDASSTELKSGDSFTINLGTYFQNLQVPASKPMTVDHNGTEVEVGTCELTAKDITCTFNGKVEELRNAGFHNFRGSGSAMLSIVESTTSKTADITANGIASVDLPGEGGIGTPNPSQWELYKWSSSFYNDYSELTWGINFGANETTGGKLGTTFTGSNRQTITFTDTLGEGMDFNSDLTRWTLNKRNGDGPGVRLTDASGADATTEHGDYDLKTTISGDGRTATIEVTGPFNNGDNFTIEYPVTFAGGKAVKGSTYNNSVTMNGTDLSSENQQAYVQYFDINVQMEPGFGSFSVTKAVEGDAADKAAGTSFPVEVAYELPAAASTYPGWTAPEGTKPEGEGRTGTATMTVKPGETTQFEGTLPKGTTVTLSEDVSKAEPAAEGYEWGTPVFVVDGKETNTFTIGDQVVTSVSLTNKAVSTPPATTPPTTAPPTTTAPPETAGPPATVPPETAPPTGTPGSPSTPGAPGTPNKPGSPPLANTGADVAALVVLVGLGLGGGALALSRRRKA